MRLIRLLKNDIAREAAEWVREDIITAPQAEKICEKYEVDYHQVKNRSFGYNVLVGLGYLFIGLSLITLIGANWEDIPRALRMWGLIALTMATHGLAIKRYLSDRKTDAVGLFLLGNLFYGASIILIAQIYHLGEHMPDGVLWWALGCLPIGVLSKSVWVTLQSMLLALVWFFMEVSMGFYPMLFPLFILSSLAVLYAGKQSTILFLVTIISIFCWVEYSFAWYWSDISLDVHSEHVAITIVMFVFSYVLSHWLGQRPSAVAKDYGVLLAVWSLRFGLICMLVMSFEDPWEELIRDGWEHRNSMMIFIGALLGVSLWLAYKNKKLNPAIYVIAFYLLTLAAVLLSDNPADAIYFQLVFNLVLIATGVYLIVRGIHDGVSHYFFLGVATILLTAFMRYVDLIGNYVGGAMLFMVFAILLLAAAKYWKRYQSKEGTV